MSAVHLGAAEYTILTTKDSKSVLKAEASVGIDVVGKADLYNIWHCMAWLHA